MTARLAQQRDRLARETGIETAALGGELALKDVCPFIAHAMERPEAMAVGRPVLPQTPHQRREHHVLLWFGKRAFELRAGLAAL
jgi:hypothetical protein